MTMELSVLNATVDEFVMNFFDPKTGQKTGDLTWVYFPFMFNYTEYTAMRTTLNETQLRQIRIDQLNMLLKQPVLPDTAPPNLAVVNDAAAAAQAGTVLEATEVKGNVIEMNPSSPRNGITRAQYDAFQVELQALLAVQTDATVFINGFMKKVVRETDLLDKGQPYDWTNLEVKTQIIESLGFAIINLAASTILERCSGGKAQGESPLARLVSVA